MNSYEIAMIVDPNMPEKDVQHLAQETKDLLVKNGAGAVADERIERRALGYSVERHTEANYIFIGFTGPTTIPDIVRLEMKHREGLLRLAFIAKPMATESAKDAVAAPAAPDSAPSDAAPSEPVAQEVAGG
ncbi:30S ribosomal protein S6 [candidate division WOR-3 bacterium]|nr:30S ribosomal protein S6 [candidate division WOR-3 bacterium]